ncbi:gliding motility lipoprotein GldH [Echinicola jeungdonensis]|uniref:Gliding motility lipoprotein GldH n=1 Tax=Echinicola jeungdonensis TaxID=709343 RepID=A0ABV5J685_9BACT|nr:gliding motility lipoprotein GldH [Echinicola jeungdonensis]MDN3669861.1 gliding motility lipoprotein GldH [Echinicola jeungdonensis]
MNKPGFGLLYPWGFLILFFISACDTNRVYEEYHGMKNQSWDIADTVSFEVSLSQDYQVASILRVKYNNNYDYHNLYVRYILRDSTGNMMENDLMDLQLFDQKSGRPLGDGFGNSYTKVDTLPLKKLTGGNKASVQFVQYMRSEALNGIESVGIKISKE